MQERRMAIGSIQRWRTCKIAIVSNQTLVNHFYLKKKEKESMYNDEKASKRKCTGRYLLKM